MTTVHISGKSFLHTPPPPYILTPVVLLCIHGLKFHRKNGESWKRKEETQLSMKESHHIRRWLWGCGGVKNREKWETATTRKEREREEWEMEEEGGSIGFWRRKKEKGGKFLQVPKVWLDPLGETACTHTTVVGIGANSSLHSQPLSSLNSLPRKGKGERLWGEEEEVGGEEEGAAVRRDSWEVERRRQGSNLFSLWGGRERGRKGKGRRERRRTATSILN